MEGLVAVVRGLLNLWVKADPGPIRNSVGDALRTAVNVLVGPAKTGSPDLLPTEYEIALAKRGNKVLAIKSYRSRTGKDLATSKGAIENAVPGCQIGEVEGYISLDKVTRILNSCHKDVANSNSDYLNATEVADKFGLAYSLGLMQFTRRD